MIDLLVVGGGPAGLATAIHGARAGLQVVVAERRSGPIDKACGEGLMPIPCAICGSRGASARQANPGYQLPGRCAARRREIQARHRARCARTVLHGALLDAAVEAGVEIVHDEIRGISQDADSVRAGRWRARYLAAADGLHSPIRRSLGLEQTSPGPRRWGIRRHVQIEPWSDYVEVRWAPGAEAYVTPVADDCVGIALLSSGRGGFDCHLEEFPALRDRSRVIRTSPTARPDHSRRKLGPHRRTDPACRRHRRLRRCAHRRGSWLGFRCRRILVDCVMSGRPQDYDRQWRQLTRRYRMLTAALLQASAYAPARSRIVPAAQAMPAVFTGIVNLLAQ